MGSKIKFPFTFSLVLLILISLCKAGCSTTEPPDNPEPVLKLELEDVSCTEAWIKLTTANLQLPTTLNLLKDNNVTKTINLQTADTLIYIDSLLPNQIYKLQVSHKVASSIQYQVSSNELSVTTMDTTSHNFTWQTWEFGQHSSSVLYDVAIIDENNIWAVGEIYMNDSLGNSVSYNAVHWNGSEWELKRILYKGGFWVIRTIFAFNANDIWFSGYIRYLNGQFLELPIPDILIGWEINKLWGSSSSDLYVVGNGGNIAHYNGSSWTKIESGTTVDLLDVWGSPDGTVWTCGYTGDYAITVLLRFDGTNWNKIYEGSSNNQNNNEYIGPISGVWSNSEHFTYVTNWAFIYTQPNKNTLDIKRITPWYSDVAFTMRGNDHNDIFIAGQDGLVGHYNGNTYKEIDELKTSLLNYYGLSIKGNNVVAVGVKPEFLSSKAVITSGRR